VAQDRSQVVTLNQIAARAHLKKDALRKCRKRPKDPFPEPDLPRARQGQPDRWYWPTVLPWMRRNCKHPLPDRFPDRWRK
jgi:hypothetical protein